MNDRFYLEAVRPYCWFAAVLLFLSYVIGLWFTLRTHAAVIWNNESEDKQKPEVNTTNIQQPSGGAPQTRAQRHAQAASDSRGNEIRDSQLYKRILGQSLKQAGINPKDCTPEDVNQNGSVQTPHLVPPKSAAGDSTKSDFQIPGFTEAQNTTFVREVAEMAATAATIAARDAARPPHRKASTTHAHKLPPLRTTAVHTEPEEAVNAEAHATSGGHDAPNWSRMKSSVILCGATVLYALIAEILVNTVDVVLSNVAIDEKFLGITLFALVPNTTEFLVSTSTPNIVCKRLT